MKKIKALNLYAGVLRNCVHPLIGEQIFNQCIEKKK